MEQLKHRARNLRDVTARLASPAEDQLAYLRRLGVAPAVDELALEFDDMYKPIALLRRNNVISAETERALRSLDSRLELMSQNADLWTDQAVREASPWQDVRHLGAQAVTLLDRDLS